MRIQKVARMAFYAVVCLVGVDIIRSCLGGLAGLSWVIIDFIRGRTSALFHKVELERVKNRAVLLDFIL